MTTNTMNHNHKINKALSLLGEAAEGKKDELRQSLHRFKKAAEKSVAESGVKIKRTAIVADKSVKKNPWAYIGGAVAGALAFGFILGKIKKKRK